MPENGPETQTPDEEPVDPQKLMAALQRFKRALFYHEIDDIDRIADGEEPDGNDPPQLHLL